MFQLRFLEFTQQKELLEPVDPSCCIINITIITLTREKKIFSVVQCESVSFQSFFLFEILSFQGFDNVEGRADTSTNYVNVYETRGRLERERERKM